MSLLTSTQLEARLARRYVSVWADALCVPDDVAWPFVVRVGKPSRAELERDFAGVMREAEVLGRWAEAHGLTCSYEPRLVGRVSYALLSHVQAADLDVLAGAVGRTEHLVTYRERLERLCAEFPRLDAAGRRQALVLLNKYQVADVDFDLACRAGTWFATHDASGLTPREVPLEGFHAKWLDMGGHRQLACLLASKESLELKERPRLVRFKYLDPEYVASGRRVHDAWLETDACELAYEPTTVIICENRDSALWFPEVAGGISVMGDGMAGVATLAQIPWIAQAKRLCYWGDMDIRGFEILSAYRERGLQVRSLLMDMATYEEYRQFGTHTDRHNRPLPPKPGATPLSGLTDAENELYLCLCDPAFEGPRRIEQERIPLDRAVRGCTQDG